MEITAREQKLAARPRTRARLRRREHRLQRDPEDAFADSASAGMSGTCVESTTKKRRPEAALSLSANGDPHPTICSTLPSVLLPCARYWPMLVRTAASDT